MWTKEKDERLLRLWNDDTDMMKLSLLMRCSYDECFNRLSELGTFMCRWSVRNLIIDSNKFGVTQV